MAHMIEKLYGVRAGARGVAQAAVRACRGPGRERDLVVQSLKAGMTSPRRPGPAPPPGLRPRATAGA